MAVACRRFGMQPPFALGDEFKASMIRQAFATLLDELKGSRHPASGPHGRRDEPMLL